jgi:hypothetical protein
MRRPLHRANFLPMLTGRLGLRMISRRGGHTTARSGRRRAALAETFGLRLRLDANAATPRYSLLSWPGQRTRRQPEILRSCLSAAFRLLPRNQRTQWPPSTVPDRVGQDGFRPTPCGPRVLLRLRRYSAVRSVWHLCLQGLPPRGPHVPAAEQSGSQAPSGLQAAVWSSAAGPMSMRRLRPRPRGSTAGPINGFEGRSKR